MPRIVQDYEIIREKLSKLIRESGVTHRAICYQSGNAFGTEEISRFINKKRNIQYFRLPSLETAILKAIEEKKNAGK